jgi:serine protease Do
MKTKNLLSYLAVASSLALTTLPLHSQQPEQWRRVDTGPGGGARPPGPPPAEKEIVTFLGVETAPVAETLAAQLNLPKDSGLVVNHVVPDSPAASVLKQHDVLVKLDDQLLVEPRQFAVLIRNHKEGDEVTFSYIRAGKQATAKVKLGKQEVKKAFYREYWGEARPAGAPDVFRTYSGEVGAGREDVNRVLKLLEGQPREIRPGNGPGPQPRAIRTEPPRDGPGFRATNINTSNSNMVFTDDQGALELTIKDGKKTLIAKNPKGEQIYSGPVNTPEERNALPREVRDRLNKIEGMQGFTFQTDDAFQPATRTIRPFPQGIAFPLPAEDGAQTVRPLPQVF